MAPPTPAPATPQQEASSSEMNSYEPEPKRLRTASAEAELKEVEAGKGTGACIKYTQVITHQSYFYEKWKSESPESNIWSQNSVLRVEITIMVLCSKNMACLKNSK